MSPNDRLGPSAVWGAIGLLVVIAGCGSTGDGSASESGSNVPSTGGASGEAATTGSASGESEAFDSGGITSPEEASEAGSGDDASSAVDDAAAIAETAIEAAVEEGSAGDSGNASGCVGGKMGVASDSTGPSTTQTTGYGTLEFNISTQNHIVALKTKLAVPPKPVPVGGTLFLWPGLQPLPGGQDYYPIGNGVLQPVLTWGGTCAPGAPNDYSSWWISGQYVNPTGPAGHTGCMGGPGIDVAVGDLLDIAMTLNGTVWTQLVTDEQSGGSVKYDIDMAGQAQNWGLFRIEMPDGLAPVSDVVFTSTMLTFASSDEADCQPNVRGNTDYFSTPQSSSDGKSCCVSKIILRAQGVAATSPNTP
jgi:hypothetical protein